MNDHSAAAADEFLILVDKEDKEIGQLDKISVHQSGLLHRAFSIFLFNSMGFVMLQQRAMSKYHSPGLWSNTCCSHPSPGERTQAACSRRLVEEMGIKCSLNFAFSFTYRAEFGNGLIEHEYDHVYFGFTDKIPKLNEQEVRDWKYISVKELGKQILAHPEQYTEWLKICFPKVLEHLASRKI
jgi:isopentenyl-diphosphate delta-isomerase